MQAMPGQGIASELHPRAGWSAAAARCHACSASSAAAALSRRARPPHPLTLCVVEHAALEQHILLAIKLCSHEVALPRIHHCRNERARATGWGSNKRRTV